MSRLTSNSNRESAANVLRAVYQPPSTAEMRNSPLVTVRGASSRSATVPAMNSARHTPVSTAMDRPFERSACSRCVSRAPHGLCVSGRTTSTLSSGSSWRTSEMRPRVALARNSAALPGSSRPSRSAHASQASIDSRFSHAVTRCENSVPTSSASAFSSSGVTSAGR